MTSPSPIIVRMRRPTPDGRTRHEGTDNLVRPLLAAQHSRHAGRNSAVFGCDVLARVRGLPGIASRFPKRQASLNSSRPIRLPGSLIPIGFHRALQVLQDALRDCADLLHFIPFCRFAGLADLLYGQQQIRRKLKCPTKALKGETR